MGQYFCKPYRSFEGNVKVELYLSIYETKAELKCTTGIDKSKSAAKVDKIDVEKLKTVPVDLIKLSNVII